MTMSEVTYKATRKDLNLISKSLEFIKNGSLDYLFGGKDVFSDVAIISYDTENIYLFNILENSYKTIPHKVRYDWERQHTGWSTGLRVTEFLEFLPSEIHSYWYISGGLFTPLSDIQAQRKSIYTSEEGYIATIIHEFGHIFFNKSNPHYYTNKKETLDYMETAVSLYSGESLPKDYTVTIPSYSGLSEVFAFCTEYSFASKYAMSHKDNIDRVFKKKIQRTIPYEKELNFLYQDTSLRSSHFYSWVIGKILLEKYPNAWHKKLTELKTIL